jgi:heat shock protein HslJ
MKNLFLGIILIFASCVAPKTDDAEIYWINSYKVDCVGVGPMKCLLIQKNKSIKPEQWQNFYSEIEGFEFEAGYICKLKVKEENQVNVPADASSVKYSLVKVLQKKKDPKLSINANWIAISIDEEEIKAGEEADGQKNAQIEIRIPEMRIVGNDGCNSITGSITKFDDGIIEFGPIAGTRMMCADMTIPDKFNIALSMVRSYKILNMKLILLDEEGKELVVFKKVD